MARIKDGRPVKHAQSVQRENKAWELRAQGWTHQRIADKLGVDVSTITKALQRAADKHHEKFMADIHAYKKAQAKVIEDAAFNALNQYYESQKARKVITQQGKMVEGKLVGRVDTTIQKIDQYGDSKLLSLFFKGMEDVRKIWGIDIHVIKKEDGKLNVDNMSIADKIALFTSIPMEDRLKLLENMITKTPVFDEAAAAGAGKSSAE